MFGQDVTVTKASMSASSGGTVFSGETTHLDGQQRGDREFGVRSDNLKSWERMGIKLAFKRNGSNLDFEVGRFLSTVTRMMEAYALFRKGLTTAVKGDATIGLSLSGELNLLVVDFAVAWQRKEDGPGDACAVERLAVAHRQAHRRQLDRDLGVVAKCTCHSVEVFNFEGSVTVAFTGNVPVSLTKTAVIRGDHRQWDAAEEAVKAALGVSISGKTTAKVMGEAAEIIVAGSSGLLVDAKLDTAGGRWPSLKGNVTFSGVTLVVSMLGLSGTVYQSKPIALIAPCDVYKNFVIGTPEGEHHMASNGMIQLVAEVRGCDAEVYLNDIPVTRLLEFDKAGTALPIHPWIVHGDNVLKLVINPGREPATALAAGSGAPIKPGASARARLVAVTLGEAPPQDGPAYIDVAWRSDARDGVPPARGPVVRSATGRMPLDFGRRHWEKGDPLVALTPALEASALAFVDELRKHLQHGQPARVAALMRDKLKDAAASYGLDAAAELAEFTAVWQRAATIPGWRLAPISADVASLRLCGQGRCVECIAKDWQPLIRMSDLSQGGLLFRVWLARVGDSWRIAF